MSLNPKIYNKLIRPKFAIKLYIERTINKLFNLKDDLVLDFGCGTGSNCYMFKPENYFGVDVDEGRIKYAKKLFPKHTFEILEGNKIAFENQTFDKVCIFATIHHICDNDFKKYLPEIHRILKPNGKIIAIEPCLFKGNRFRNWFMNFIDDGKHIRSETSYQELFDKKLFKVKVHKKFRKFFIYNELFFSAEKI
ncbi:class I SAM-dependent methyltransferase [Patescibacteria group bacterium]